MYQRIVIVSFVTYQQAGYDGLHPDNQYYIDSSVDLVRGTNVGRPGRWMFTVSSSTASTSNSINYLLSIIILF